MSWVWRRAGETTTITMEHIHHIECTYDFDNQSYDVYEQLSSIFIMHVAQQIHRATKMEKETTISGWMKKKLLMCARFIFDNGKKERKMAARLRSNLLNWPWNMIITCICHWMNEWMVGSGKYGWYRFWPPQKYQFRSISIVYRLALCIYLYKIFRTHGVLIATLIIEKIIILFIELLLPMLLLFPFSGNSIFVITLLHKRAIG